MIAYGCLLIAVLLPYFFTVLAKAGPGFNNHRPRDYLEHLQGWRKRAYWAQLNGFEAFPPFAVAVLVAQQSHVAEPTLNSLAITFIIARILHGICYIINQAALRTLVWAVGFGCVIALFVLSLT